LQNALRVRNRIVQQALGLFREERLFGVAQRTLLKRAFSLRVFCPSRAEQQAVLDASRVLEFTAFRDHD